MNLNGITGHERQIKHLEFLLKSGKIPQSILFSGPSGIGKKLLAKRYINSIFCKNTNPPCLTCSVCRQIASGTFPDFIEIYPNEKDIIPIGNEETREPGSIRWLIDRLSSKSITGRSGILIDGIDRATEEGQNALLKTIEEPSEGTLFVLISSNKNNLLPTILSRCTEIRFSPLFYSDIKKIIGENISSGLSESEIDLALRISGGRMDIAEIAADREVFRAITEFCREISLFLSEGKILEADPASIQNKISIELLLDIIINIYRQNLLSIIKKEKVSHPDLKEIYIDDAEKVREILKIFMNLKIDQSHNLNIKNALKSMLYSLDLSQN